MQGAARRKGEENLHVEFFLDAVEDKKATLERGALVTNDVEHVRITVPGSRPLTVVHKVTEELRSRFPIEYERWKRCTTEKPRHGFPLEEWPHITASVLKKLHFYEVRTVEQLAALPDNVVDSIGAGGMNIRRKAQDFLTAAKEQAPIAAMAEENRLLKLQLEAIQGEMTKLNARFEAERGKKRGE